MLHDTLDGHGGELWDSSWRLAAAVEAETGGADALDAVLAHPYTRTWLLDALADADAGRPLAEPAAERFAATVAAAAVRALGRPPGARGVPRRKPAPAHARHRGPRRAGGPGRAVVRPADGGLLVREPGAAPGTEVRVAHDEPEGPRWLPVRVLRRRRPPYSCWKTDPSQRLDAPCRPSWARAAPCAAPFAKGVPRRRHAERRPQVVAVAAQQYLTTRRRTRRGPAPEPPNGTRLTGPMGATSDTPDPHDPATEAEDL
ncbi:hypothetical protein SCALM49S_01401 [Streptomyces californicus]